MGKFCTQCGAQRRTVAKYCQQCGVQFNDIDQYIPKQQQEIAAPTIQNHQPVESVQPVQPQARLVQVHAPSSLWVQNQYVIRKKVMTIGNKYWIEDITGTILGFCKQKIMKLKEDIRIYTDESLSNELFRIQQQQIFDVWGNFSVIDSASTSILGYVKREIWSEIGRDAWDVQNAHQQSIGRIIEKSLGRALTRKFVPMGGLLPEKMQLELNGQVVAEINQEFKIIGDIWSLSCFQVPPDFDRRVLLACMILMGTIERQR